MKTMTHREFIDECRKRFGEDPHQWKFVCPACGTVQSLQDLINAGLSENEAHNKIAFSCIGRVTGQGEAGIAAKRRGEPWDKGCNWTLGGLLKTHTLEVITKNERGEPHNRPTFELADAPAAHHSSPAPQPS